MPNSKSILVGIIFYHVHDKAAMQISGSFIQKQFSKVSLSKE